MVEGQFCFLLDQYYIDFPDDKLMRNKETVTGLSRNRPCFFVFPDTLNSQIMWLIPISSKIEKYQNIYNNNVAKYGFCDTIHFGTVAGNDAAFLIQNICPVTRKYIREIYLDKNNIPIKTESRTVATVIQNATAVLAKAWRGSRVVLPDFRTIYASLVRQLEPTINAPGIMPYDTLRDIARKTREQLSYCQFSHQSYLKNGIEDKLKNIQCAVSVKDGNVKIAYFKKDRAVIEELRTPAIEQKPPVR